MVYYIGIGSNLGNRLKYIRKATVLLKETPDLKLKKVSPVYETEPQGGPKGQRPFYNLVMKIESRLGPQELLGILKKIELLVGRKARALRWSAREIDLDILSAGATVVKEKRMNVPHPRLHQRYFILKPFADLSPGYKHPILKKSIKALLKEAKKRGKVRKIEETVSIS